MPAIRFLAPAMVLLGVLDTVLKEMPWVPAASKTFAFYVLGPVVAVGMIGLIPYIRERIAIVTPKATSNFVLTVAMVLSTFQLLLWGLLYYDAEFVGTSSVHATALLLKDVILVSSAVVFGLTGIRLLQWFRRTKNIVVLAFALVMLQISAFASLHTLPDFFSTPIPRIVTDGIAIVLASMFFFWVPPVIYMNRSYFGRLLTWQTILYLGLFSLTLVLLITNRLGIPVDVVSKTILLSGLALVSPAAMLRFFALVPAMPNLAAKEYFRGIGYAFGLWGIATCGMGLGLPAFFPLSGFASLSMLLPSACLAFATFTSAASYFSISEDVRSQIRQATSFVASIGEAESIISTERQVGEFYDRFSGMAKASGAVESSAISKDEIYQYAKALKKIQSART